MDNIGTNGRSGGTCNVLQKTLYKYVSKLLKKRLDDTVLTVIDEEVYSSYKGSRFIRESRHPDFRAKTAVFLVNGFSGLGLHTLLQ